MGTIAKAPTLFVLHDPRHIFGTMCAASGVPVGDIQVYMGHANLSTTQIYIHHAPKHDAAERLTEAFGEASSVDKTAHGGQLSVATTVA